MCEFLVRFKIRFDRKFHLKAIEASPLRLKSQKAVTALPMEMTNNEGSSLLFS